MVLDAYCLRIYKYEAGISNIYPEVGVSNRGGGDARTYGCVRAWSACVRAMDVDGSRVRVRVRVVMDI